MSEQSGYLSVLPSWLTGKRRRIQQFEPEEELAAAQDPNAQYAQASNVETQVFELIRPILASETCLIATGYQDFLSALSIILSVRPDIATAQPDTLRIVFGTNTDNSVAMRNSRRSLPEQVKRHFLGKRGLSVGDKADWHAVLAKDAIESGAINFRVFDQAIAAEKYGKTFRMLHAKSFIGESAAVLGSANFSNAGLRHNIELVDRFPVGSEAYSERKKDTEGFWDCGRDWNQEALDILDRLLRLVSPEEATARVTGELLGFKPWDVSENKQTTGRKPAPYQSELVYEAAGTIYEHGFAFIEAPTGSGKTDIGKHLGTVLPSMYDKIILEESSDASHRRRQGAFGLIPPAVIKNWDTQTGSNFRAVSSSLLSKDDTKSTRKTRQAAKNAEADGEVKRHFLNSAACIIDESHRFASRWLSPSTRSRNLEESPSIWTACLSATLLGNRGLDGLMAFHEKRASIYMSSEFAAEVTQIIEREQSREIERRKALEPDCMEQENSNLFDMLDGENVSAEKVIKGTPDNQPKISSYEAQVELSRSLAPFVCRRERHCIGESRDRSQKFSYPEIKSVRCNTQLTERQKEIIEEITSLTGQISQGYLITSTENKRYLTSEINVADKARLHARNFLSAFRSSILFTRHEWSEGAIGRLLQEAESKKKERRHKGKTLQGELALSEYITPEIEEERKWADNPLCRRINELLFDPALDELDRKRAYEMASIITRHKQAVFLCDRVGALQVFAQLVGQLGRGKIEVMTAFQNNKDPHKTIFGRKKKAFTERKDGKNAQEYFAKDGSKSNTDAHRAVFMTYHMAEGINLQSASAMGLISVTSDLTHMVQGMGRIDRIDSLHPEATYYTFDLPGVSLPSDAKARERNRSIEIFAGKDFDENKINADEIFAGDLTDLIIKGKKSPRTLRPQNFYDTVHLIEREIDTDILERVKKSKAKGVWGADLCLIPGQQDFTLFALHGVAPGLGHHSSDLFPPRLVGVTEGQVMRGQEECVNLLLEGYMKTKAQGAHKTPGTKDQVSDVLGKAMGNLAALTHWDLRPERTVSLLASLAWLLDHRGSQYEQGPDDLGASVFSQLTLPALEYIANEWSILLDPSWIAIKKDIQAKAEEGLGAADYIDINGVMSFFLLQSTDQIQAAREKMRDVVDTIQDRTEDMEPSIQDRVAVVFQSVQQ